MIIDEKELILFLPTIIGGAETVLALTNHDILAQFIGYFNRLWSDSIKLSLDQAIKLDNKSEMR